MLSTLLRLRLIKTITVHNFAYLKNDLINYIVHLSQRKLSSNCFNNHNILFSFTTHFKSSSPTTSRESRLVVDKDDTGKFRFERVNPYTAKSDYGRVFSGKTFPSICSVNACAHLRLYYKCGNDVVFLLYFNPSTAKLFNLNFHPLEVVSR